MKGPYTKPGRLSDVLALIQVLSLDKYTHRTEDGLFRELLRLPSVGKTWMAVGAEHPEFFRIGAQPGSDENHLSLVGRHVVPRDGDDIKRLPSDFVYQLLHTAIELHDRQVEAAERWKNWVPLASALAAALIASVTTLFALWLNGWCKP